MNVSHPVNSQLVEAGQKVPRRVHEALPVTLKYSQALALRQLLGIAAVLVRTMSNDMPCDGGTDRCLHCQTESLADDLRASELLLRGEG